LQIADFRNAIESVVYVGGLGFEGGVAVEVGQALRPAVHGVVEILSDEARVALEAHLDQAVESVPGVEVSEYA